MTAALHMRIERRQTQTVTPRLQHAVRLLQLSSLDFALRRKGYRKRPLAA